MEDKMKRKTVKPKVSGVDQVDVMRRKKLKNCRDNNFAEKYLKSNKFKLDTLNDAQARLAQMLDYH